ncbi:MAG: SMC family ATPase [Actinomycetaceae bacterium]|nr:SMC family ATPase [Actinomycetaceae bacterium]
MRLIELKFAALGPFAGEQCIRFADFEAAGLFLLRGATGSGKSSIIDAVLFALYGESPLKDTSSTQRLRSNFADSQTASYAELLFEVPAGAYLVRRSPRYVKAGNKNATAGTAVLEKVQLVDDQIVGREPLGAKPAEVNALIPEILGIQHSQFLQTVVLPQGKFAEFVRATPDSRKQLLQQIFKTHQFDRFTEALKEKSKAAKAQYEALVSQARFLSGSIVGEDTAQLPVEQLLEAASEKLTADMQWADRCEQAAGAAKADALEASFLLKETLKFQQIHAEFSDIKAQQESLMAQADHFADLDQQVRLAQGAKEVVAAHGRWEELQVEITEKEATLAQQFGFDTSISDGFATAQAKEATLTELLKVKETQLRQLQLLEQKESLLAEQKTAQANLQASVKHYQSRLSEAEKPLDILAEQIRQLKEADLEKPAAQAEVTRLQERLEHSRQGDQKRVELVACAEEIGIRKRDYMQAVRDYERAWEVWQADAARQLAALLQPGEACLVCGSQTHPAPAHTVAGVSAVASSLEEKVDDSAVTESNREIAETSSEVSEVDPAATLAACAQIVTDKRVALELKQSQQGEITAEITKLNALAGSHTRHLEELLESAQGHLQQLDAKLTEATALEQILKAAKDELAEIEKNKLTAEVRGEEIGKLVALLDTEVAQLHQSLQAESVSEDLVFDSTQLAVEVSELEQALAIQKQLLTELSALTSLTQLAINAAESFEKLLDDSSFTNIDEAREALEAVPSLETALQELATYRAQLAQVVETYTQLAPQAEAIGELPNVNGLKAIVGVLQKRFEEAQAQAIRSTTLLASQQKLFAQLQTQLEQITTQETTSGYLLRLAELALGAKTATGTAIPLSTWVLIERFEAVIAAANPFIARFSNDRFKLLRVDEDGNSSAQHGGLGISVFDNETERQRPSKTLSGGETFYVSLALALGLAEVVSAEAGGIDFKSMLIDEGFGSLDPETLDKVLEGIKQINHSGRTVGIVSHVEELRRRISDGIEVVPNPAGGSKLRIYS